MNIDKYISMIDNFSNIIFHYDLTNLYILIYKLMFPFFITQFYNHIILSALAHLLFLEEYPYKYMVYSLGGPKLNDISHTNANFIFNAKPISS